MRPEARGLGGWYSGFALRLVAMPSPFGVLSLSVVVTTGFDVWAS